MREIKSGYWTLVDLLKINALLDMQDDMAQAESDKPEEGGED